MTAYTIVGAGAIGGVLASHLAVGGHDVDVIDADVAHVSRIRAHGVRILRGDVAEGCAPLAARTPDEAAAAGVRPQRVLLATKAHQTEAASEWLASRLTGDGFVAVFQNGDGHARAAGVLGADRVVPVFVNLAADRVGPGTVRWGGPGQIAIGERDGRPSERVTRLVADLAGLGDVRATDNVRGLIWAKRVLAVLLTATALVDDDIVRVVGAHRATMRVLAAEALAVAEAHDAAIEPIDGIDWSALHSGGGDPVAAVERFLTTLPDKPRSGVFRDLTAGRVPTEASIELAGLIALGESGGVPVPTLLRLHDGIVAIERGERTFGAQNLLDLVPATGPLIERTVP